jgi:hypothetical protein
MHKSILLVSLIVPALFTGCVGTGPNTQQGAVAGGTLGAIAGAVIGNNSRGGDALGGAVLGGIAGALAGGALGNSVDQQKGTLYDSYGYPVEGGYRRTVVTQQVTTTAAPQPPPAPAENIGPAPAPNAVWVPGFWIYDGRSYTWNAGKWEVPPPNAHSYVAAHWAPQGSGYVYVPGAWQ